MRPATYGNALSHLTECSGQLLEVPLHANELL